ncbi:MAG: 3-hydroxyacyl-CoA dehydrogenase family protein, partial [Candidatus Paceibacteria bacterium]
TTVNYDDLMKPDEQGRVVGLIIEAVFERMADKQEVFAELDKILPPEVIFATNTSSLSISEMANATNRKDKVIGVHFFNPPITMALVELISGQETSLETVETLEDFTKNSLGKVPIRVKECPGFLVNRLLMPYLNEATLLLSETNLRPEEIDQRARNFGWPMGPFFLMDYLGIDVCAEVAKILESGYGERVKSAPLMDVLVKLGRYGNKTGAGFYVKDETKGFENLTEILNREFPNRKDLDVEEGYRRMILGMVNEAFMCLEEGIASAEDIEKGCLYGIGFPFILGGPLHWAESEGLDKILTDLKRFEQQYGMRFKPAKLLEEYVSSGKKRIFETKEEW